MQCMEYYFKYVITRYCKIITEQISISISISLWSKIIVTDKIHKDIIWD